RVAAARAGQHVARMRIDRPRQLPADGPGRPGKERISRLRAGLDSEFGAPADVADAAAQRPATLFTLRPLHVRHASAGHGRLRRTARARWTGRRRRGVLVWTGGGFAPARSIG